jgi:hypothetical protein
VQSWCGGTLRVGCARPGTVWRKTTLPPRARRVPFSQPFLPPVPFLIFKRDGSGLGLEGKAEARRWYSYRNSINCIYQHGRSAGELFVYIIRLFSSPYRFFVWIRETPGCAIQGPKARLILQNPQRTSWALPLVRLALCRKR